jgi:hypothetical protein
MELDLTTTEAFEETGSDTIFMDVADSELLSICPQKFSFFHLRLENTPIYQICRPSAPSANIAAPSAGGVSRESKYFISVSLVASFFPVEVGVADVGTAVAVKTPVGKPLVVPILCVVAAFVGLVVGGRVNMELGVDPGKPAAATTLGSGIGQSASSLYSTPFMITPALFANMFF